jgi:hypothetical protein
MKSADPALRLLADHPEGCTEALMLAQGFGPAMIAELIEAGLARARTERVPTGRGRSAVKVTRMRITEAGRAMIEPGRKASDLPRRPRITGLGLGREQLRVLEVLADCPEGCTTAMLHSHGFSIDRINDLVRTGLATGTKERVAGRKPLEVTRVKITDSGRRALK